MGLAQRGRRGASPRFPFWTQSVAEELFPASVENEVSETARVDRGGAGGIIRQGSVDADLDVLSLVLVRAGDDL